MGWYLCTIASTSKRNWELCKISRTWGINTQDDYASHDLARRGDSLLFWLGGAGYVGYAKVLEDARPPLKAEEAPWQGGMARYGRIIPLGEIHEFDKPMKMSFTNRKQILTGLDQSLFQRGYMPITDSVIDHVMGYKP